MEFGEISKRTTDAVCRSLDTEVGEEVRATINRIIEEAIVDVVARTSQRCVNAAVRCCGPEADLAHKIAEGIEQAQVALIANLSSLR